MKKESNLLPAAKHFYQELMSERERFPNTMPYAWLLAKFHQLHLDVFTHNFTLNYPFRNEKVIKYSNRSMMKKLKLFHGF